MKFLKHYLSLLKKKFLNKKISYSFGGCDLLINYIFKNQSKGFYIDIGCQNPIANSNTYLLHKKGWTGMNIDLDQKNIDLFNLSRPNDINLCLALSSSNEIKNLYFYHEGSAVNSLSHELPNYKNDSPTIKKIKTHIFNNVLEQYNIKTIDYLNIDVEGHELEVLKGFNIKKYNPKVISIEYLDLSLKKLEFKNNKIENVLNSDIYKYFINHNYSFVSWSHSDLIFISNDFRD
tara:strand:+ start:90 stop:788 length:699 start_codon:yes stop_codon:yes gene_type:complete